MTPKLDIHRSLSRRDMLKHGLQGGLGAIGALSLTQWLVGCVSPASATGTSGVAQAVTGNAGTWATGGTAAMKGGYPDPFLTSTGGTPCAVMPSATLGPCYVDTLTRKDISDGLTGLPLRLALKVVHADTCEPVAGANVDVWHTNAAGYYSGFAKGTMCNPTGAEAATSRFFRGVQTTDANGRVDFDTVFPGWYSGRTVHIHFTVRVGNQAYLTSQLVFDDTLTTEIFQAHKDYNSRPNRDTTNQNDNVVRAATVAEHVLATARMTDGALQAWKTIAIRQA